jgi:hypothetical protein
MPAELTPAEALADLRKEIECGRRYSYVSPATANRLEKIADSLAAAVEDAERFAWAKNDDLTIEELRAAIDAARTPAPGERT